MTRQLKDKFRGVLLGMACGDALGAQVEFKKRDTYPHQLLMMGGGPHRLEPGQWTDDTAMALHLLTHMRAGDETCEDRHGLALRWLGWYRKGDGSCTGTCFDIGTQTAGALAHWERHGTAPTHDPKKRGNGALMRVAPVALVHYGHDSTKRANAEQAAIAQALVTHGRECAGLCAVYVDLLVRCMALEPEQALAVLRAAHPQVARRRRARVNSTGYDVDTFEAAVWAVCNSESTGEAIVLAANLGNDADTVAAVTGALAGAVWGTEGLRSQWLDCLAWNSYIAGLADVCYFEAA